MDFNKHQPDYLFEYLISLLNQNYLFINSHQYYLKLKINHVHLSLDFIIGFI